MNCEEFCALIDDHLDQELAYEQTREWLDHRRGCPDCAQRAELATRTHAAIAAATIAYATSIPTPARPVLRSAHSHQTPRIWWWGSAIAATLLIGIGVLTHRSEGERASAPLTTAGDPAQRVPDVRQRIAELRAIKAWQDDLVQSLTTRTQPPADRLWRMVACTYLPPDRVPPEVIARLPMSGGESDPSPVTVVSWQRTTRRGDHATVLDFKQLNDGSVHIEQRVTSPEEEVITRVDAASWDVLREQHEGMCREIGLFNPETGIQAGWPLPARGHIERQARYVLRGESAPTGLALSLLTLHLASSVKNREELTLALRQVIERPAIADNPIARHTDEPQDHRDELRALEQTTGAARYSDEEWKLAMRCLAPARYRTQ